MKYDLFTGVCGINFIFPTFSATVLRLKIVPQPSCEYQRNNAIQVPHIHLQLAIYNCGLQLSGFSLMSVGAQWERAMQGETYMGEKSVYVKLPSTLLLMCWKKAINNGDVMSLKLLSASLLHKKILISASQLHKSRCWAAAVRHSLLLIIRDATLFSLFPKEAQVARYACRKTNQINQI